MTGRVEHHFDDHSGNTFEDYNNCVLLDVHRWSNYPEVLAARNQMLEELGFKGTKKEINHVTVVLLSLYHTHCMDPYMWVLYSRDRNDFNPGQRYNQLFIKYDILIRTIDGLLDLGYIENKKGFNDRRPGGKSFGPRMRATEKLIDMLEHVHGVHFHMIGKYVPDEMVVLRNAEGEDIDYSESKPIKAMKEILENYNKLLVSTYIDIHFDVLEIKPLVEARNRLKDKETGAPKDYRLVINLTNKRVRRIFNNSTFNQGGRFYGGWWQNIPSTLRKHIIINRDYTVEVDYSGQHIYLLYAMKGINFADLEKEAYVYPKDDDPYQHRDILKVLLLAAINSKSEESCIKAVQYEINMNRNSFPDELPNLKELYAMFKEYHEDIADMFCSKLGSKLQRIDSSIAEYVVHKMTEAGIPVLVVHDSFICSKSEETYLHQVMIEAFRHHAATLQISDSLADEISFNPVATTTKDITLSKPEVLREDDILIDYLGWVDKPQGRRFTNYLLTIDPTTNVVIKVHNLRITEVGVDISEPVFLDEDFDMEPDVEACAADEQ